VDLAGRKVEGSNPGASGPIRTDDPCLRRAALSSAELRRDGTRGQNQTDDWASPAPVLFATPPGYDARCGRTASDAYETRTRTSRMDGPALFHRAHAPGGPMFLRRAGRIRTDGLGAPNAARSQTALQPLSSGGRGRSPASWFRARCAAGYTSPEWCVPGGSNSDPRGRSPLGFQLPQRRRGAGDRPARASGGD
jgi:hypothetical protein